MLFKLSIPLIATLSLVALAGCNAQRPPLRFVEHSYVNHNAVALDKSLVDRDEEALAHVPTE